MINLFIKILVEIKRNLFGNYSLKTYSQEGEDLILNRILGDKKKGFYVDVGAHHPKRFSNTYFFYKKGWNGINIDAMPGSMKLFNIYRSKDINLEIPISNRPQNLTYHLFDEPALNGFSNKLSQKRNKTSNYRLLSTIELKTDTLSNVLDKYLKDDQKIDFMTIDVEGLDFDVLKSLDLKKFRPKIILIEILDKSIDTLIENEVHKYLKEKKYSFFAKTFNTNFFKCEIQ